MSKPSGLWTDEIIEAVRVKWLARGLTATQIAKDAGPGFNRNMIIGKMDRAGLKGGRLRPPSQRSRDGKRIYPSRAKPKKAPPYQRPLNFTLADLPAKSCHYPAGNGPYTFCGASIDRESYCAYHFALTHYGHRSNAQQQRPASPQGVETPPPPSPPDAAGESLPTGIPEHHSKAIEDAKMVLWFYAHNKAGK